MFFSLLKWWMLKRRWKIGNTVKVQPLGNLDSIQLRDDLQNWLDFLLSSASLDKSSPSSTQETQIHPTMEHIQEVQDWRWFKCQMSQAQFEWCHFQILWNYVCIYIFIRLNIHQSFCCRMEFSMHSSYHQSSASSETCGFKASKLHIL